MRLTFYQHPEGMADNSPTFQRWVWRFRHAIVPKGRLKWAPGQPSLRDLWLFLGLFPNAKALGYFQISLRENLHCDAARPAV